MFHTLVSLTITHDNLYAHKFGTLGSYITYIPITHTVVKESSCRKCKVSVLPFCQEVDSFCNQSFRVDWEVNTLKEVRISTTQNNNVSRYRHIRKSFFPCSLNQNEEAAATNHEALLSLDVSSIYLVWDCFFQREEDCFQNLLFTCINPFFMPYSDYLS